MFVVWVYVCACMCVRCLLSNCNSNTSVHVRSSQDTERVTVAKISPCRRVSVIQSERPFFGLHRVSNVCVCVIVLAGARCNGETKASGSGHVCTLDPDSSLSSTDEMI